VLFTLVPTGGLIEAGQTVDVEVFIDSVDDLMAYEASLEVTSGDTGELTLTDVIVDHTRQDWAFVAASGVTKDGVVSRRQALAAANGGVPVTGPAYLATFSYQASVDASGTFQVSVRTGQDILILNDSDGQPYETDPGIGTSIEVTIECLTNPDCDDDNDCTIDACVNYECFNDNASQGAPCDDGLFCTPNDECDGNGTCVGSGIRCPKGQWCDEINDECRLGPPEQQ